MEAEKADGFLDLNQLRLILQIFLLKLNCDKSTLFLYILKLCCSWGFLGRSNYILL